MGQRRVKHSTWLILHLRGTGDRHRALGLTRYPQP